MSSKETLRRLIIHQYCATANHIQNGQAGYAMLFIGFALAAIYHSPWWYAGCVLFGYGTCNLDRQMRRLFDMECFALHETTKL